MVRLRKQKALRTNGARKTEVTQTLDKGHQMVFMGSTVTSDSIVFPYVFRAASAVTVACGFLHDVVEDAPKKRLMIWKRIFVRMLTNIVDSVTKLGKVEYKSTRSSLAENHRMNALWPCLRISRVILVKLADRFCTICVPLKHLRKDKQERISRETMEIYAPLAHPFGY